MYESIPNELRNMEASSKRMEPYKRGLLHRAASAIENLRRRETPMKIAEIHVDEYYCPACGAENNCDQGNVQDAYCPACGQRLLSDPTKEEA